VAAAVLAGAAVGLALWQRAPRNADLAGRFEKNRREFVQLRDMILSEPMVAVVGLDRVGDHRLFDGAWTTPSAPFASRGESEMLDAVGLSPDRYAAYRGLLSRVGAYRVERAGSRSDRRGVVFLLPDGAAERGLTRRVLFAPQAPGTLVPLARAGGAGTTFARLDDGWYVECRRD
jgi:hypothetical protein